MPVHGTLEEWSELEATAVDRTKLLPSPEQPHRQCGGGARCIVDREPIDDGAPHAEVDGPLGERRVESLATETGAEVACTDAHLGGIEA